MVQKYLVTVSKQTQNQLKDNSSEAVINHMKMKLLDNSLCWYDLRTKAIVLLTIVLFGQAGNVATIKKSSVWFNKNHFGSNRQNSDGITHGTKQFVQDYASKLLISTIHFPKLNSEFLLHFTNSHFFQSWTWIY